MSQFSTGQPLGQTKFKMSATVYPERDNKTTFFL